MRLASIFAFGLLLAAPATAQEILGEYFALLSPADMRNSSGARLGSLGQVIQQDRANYHRFGRRDELDQGDSFFADRALRARIPQMVQVRPGFQYIATEVEAGRTRYVWIRIIGSKGVPQILEISEGAG